MITFTIDTLTPCLTETSTGEIFETEVYNYEWTEEEL